MSEPKDQQQQEYDLLSLIMFEQSKYDKLVKDRLCRKYPTKAARLFAKAEAMQNEIAEIKQELKQYWGWWRGNAGTENEKELVIDEELRKKLAIEGIDVMKFLFSYFLELQIFPK